MSSQSITLPSTPTAGAFASFGTISSPRAASIEARLELSLGAYTVYGYISSSSFRD